MTRQQLIEELSAATARIHEQDQTIASLQLHQEEHLSIVEDLAVTKKRFEALLELVPIGVSIATDTSCREIIQNPVAAKILRVNAWDSVSHSATPAPAIRILRDGKELSAEDMPVQRSAWFGQEIDRDELEFIWNDGAHKIISFASRPLYNANSTIVGAITASADITERKQREDALKQHRDHLQLLVSQQETLYQNCLDSMLDRLVLFSTVRDENGTIVNFICEFVNKATCLALGKPKEEFTGQPLLHIWPESRGELFDAYVKVCETGIPYSNENLNYADINRRITGKYEIEAFKWGEGLGVSIRDVTEKRTYEEELKKRQDKFEAVFYNNLAAMAVIKPTDGTFLDVNPAWEQMTGCSREEAIGFSATDLHLLDPHAFGQEKRSAVCSQGSLFTEYNFVKKTGEARTAIYSKIVLLRKGTEKLYLYTFIDVTEQRLLEKELSRLDRLNIVGEMAAGIGHEIRNPMTTVRGYLQLFQQKKQFSEYYDQLRTMIEELDRANSIISEFLSLAKNKFVEMKIGNISTVVQALFPLLQAEAFQMGHEIDAHTMEVPDIRLDERELRQLLHNLVRNGLEAMPSSGKITITTYCDSDKIVLSVQDTGTGIPAHIAGRLGVPFVTTKDNGTGLGLSVCYRIAQRHNAQITIETSSRGTIFLVTFPASIEN